MPKLIPFTEAIQWIAFILLLVGTPLVRGATSRWTFCIALWLAAVALTAMISKRLWQNKGILPRSALDWPILLLLVIAIATLFTSIHTTASLWAFFRLLLYVSIFYLTLDAADSRERAQMVILTILFMGLVLSFIGFTKYHSGAFANLWMDSHGGRLLSSTFINHNHLAGYLEMVLPLGLGLLINRPFGHPLIWSGSLLLILVALGLSMSRGAWIGAFIAVEFLLVLFLLKRQISGLKVGIIALALFVTTGLTILASNPVIERLQSLRNPQETTLRGRIVVWKGALQLIRESPLQGTGLGTFPWSFTSVRPPGLTRRYREAHNDYLQVLTEMGLPVLVPFIWGLVLIFKKGIGAFLKTSSRFRTGILMGALGGVIAVLVHSISDFNIQITSNGILFSCLIGLIMGTRERRT